MERFFCARYMEPRRMSAKLTINTPHLGLVIARRNSGKTHLQKFMLYTLARAQWFKWVLVSVPLLLRAIGVVSSAPRMSSPCLTAEQVERVMERQAELREGVSFSTITLVRPISRVIYSRKSPARVDIIESRSGRHFSIIINVPRLYAPMRIICT